MRIVVALITLVLLAGCAENRYRAQEATAFYTSQQQLAAVRKPLFELKAQPGQVITLSGVESLTVNDPREQRVDALPEHRSQLLDAALGVAKIGAQVYGLKLATDGVVNLADTIGKNGGDHSTTNIMDSFNKQGDTLNGSIKGNVSGAGAGVGNHYSDGSTHIDGNGNASGQGNNVTNGNGNAVGDGNYVPSGDNNRQDSNGPTTGGQGGNCTGGSGSSSGSSGSTGTGDTGSGTGGSGAPGGSCAGGGAGG